MADPQPWMDALPLGDPDRVKRALAINAPGLLGPLASLKSPSALERTPGIVSPPSGGTPSLAEQQNNPTSLAIRPAQQQPLSEVATNRNSLGERNVNASPTGDHGGVSRPAPGPASEEAGKRPLAVTPKLSDQYGEVQSSLASLSAKPQEPKANIGKRILGTMLELSTNPSMSSMGQRWLHPAATEQVRQKGVLEERAKGIQEQSQIANTESEIAARQNPKPDKPESLTNEEAQAVEDLVAKGTPRVDAIAQVKSAGQKPEKPERPQTEVIKRRVNGKDRNILIDKQTGKDIGDLGEVGEKPPTEPGNYQPVTDARGNTVGWVDPKSRNFTPVSAVPGASQAAGGGTPNAPLPRKPTGQEESRLAQAEVVTRAGNDLIGQIDKNRKSLGNMKAIINSAFLGTPLSDPVSSGIAAQLASFAALNPAMHGFRGTDALREFEKLTGKLPNNPDSMIAAIKGILRTASAFSPEQAPTQGGGGFKPF